MSEMTLEQAIAKLDSKLCTASEYATAWPIVKAHLTRAPVQVKDEVTWAAARALFNSRKNNIPMGVDREERWKKEKANYYIDAQCAISALESARLAQPVADPVDCRNAGAGNGLCDQCASGNYEQCRYTQRQPQPVVPADMDNLVASLQSVRDRWMSITNHDGLDGDFDILLDAINYIKRSQTHPQAAQGGEANGEAAVEISPEFTDSARGAIAWVLYHHQGGSSPIGQPLRFALGMDAHEHLPKHLIDQAKHYASWAGATTERFHAESAAVPDGWVPTDAEVRAWMERNDLDNQHLSQMRIAIDDARSMHLLSAAPTLAGKDGA